MTQSSPNKQYLVYNPTGTNKMEWRNIPSAECELTIESTERISFTGTEITQHYPLVLIFTFKNNSSGDATMENNSPSTMTLTMNNNIAYCCSALLVSNGGDASGQQNMYYTVIPLGTSYGESIPSEFCTYISNFSVRSSGKLAILRLRMKNSY